MIPIKSEYKHDPATGTYGDCHRACIASILELPRHAVPHFLEDNCSAGVFHARVEAFLRSVGFRQFSAAYTASEDVSVGDFLKSICRHSHSLMDTFFILGVRSPAGCGHSVVCRGLEVVWDPTYAEKPAYLPLDGHYWITILYPVNLPASVRAPAAHDNADE